jgi:hypothetical protein
MNQPVAIRPPGPRFGVSIGVLLVGLAAAIVGVVMIVSAFWQLVNGPSYAVPSVLRVHLGSGDYKIYEYERFGNGDGFRSAPPLVNTSTVSPSPVRPAAPARRSRTATPAIPRCCVSALRARGHTRSASAPPRRRG